MADECSAHLYAVSYLYPADLQNKYTDYVQLFWMAFEVEDDKQKTELYKNFVDSFTKTALLTSPDNPIDIEAWFSQFTELLDNTDCKTLSEIFLACPSPFP